MPSPDDNFEQIPHARIRSFLIETCAECGCTYEHPRYAERFDKCVQCRARAYKPDVVLHWNRSTPHPPARTFSKRPSARKNS
jgi:hypothetical protein